MKLTRKQIQSWCSPSVFLEAEKRAKQGAVIRADVDGDTITGLVARDTTPVLCKFRVLPNGLVDTDCKCYMSREQGLVCAHVIALALNILQRQNDPVRQQRYLEEQRHARRIEENNAAAIRRDRRGRPARLLLQFQPDWTAGFERGKVTVLVGFRVEGIGQDLPPERIDRSRPLALSEDDDLVLGVLEDMAEEGLKGKLELNRIDFLGLLDVCRGQEIYIADGTSLYVERKAAPFSVMMDLDRENGDLLLFAKADVPELGPGEFPLFLAELEKSWALAGRRLWPLKPTLPLPYHGLYRDVISIPRAGALSFLANELPSISKKIPFEFEPDASPDCFTTTPGPPVFHLTLSGGRGSVTATLRACYGTDSAAAGAPEAEGAIASPDPEDLRHFFGRNLPAERLGLSYLTAAGFIGERGDALRPVLGERAILNVLGGLVPRLRRLGWKIETQGELARRFDSAEMAIPVVDVVTPHGAGGSFDVGMDFQLSSGRSIPQARIQQALNKGDSFLDFEGETILLDSDAIEAMRNVFRDCEGQRASKPGRFQLPSVYGPYVQASLNALDGVDFEVPPDWRAQAERCNRDLRMKAEPLGRLENVLRPYQKEGVYWMRFLEQSGFCGILADEMGLGKTLQTLTWLSLPRLDEAARGKPALIVAPTSLVENWHRECEKFTPGLSCLVMSGTGRHEHWDEIGKADLVITSYALLRRDLDHYATIDFSAAVLDEAQQIKNRTTQNAVAAKKLHARQKLVLTGTPVENGVADLWSIMDFLMPGYLGVYDTFKGNYEVPIAAGGKDAEEAQRRLHRKLRPFLLRRLKKEVAKDLPDKIQKISFSTLTPDQERVYTALLAVFRKKVGDLVAKKGFDHCRMEVLAILLRLRQLCCHLSLLPPEMRGPGQVEAPSGKMAQFFDLLDQAIDGGHRILVFSQFTGMLQLLREELEARGLRYCYLDGGTKDRMEQCKRFNQDASIPVFLISLKAGGTGLNLTGADMVVHYDPWWNPAVEDQATDRAHRIGQKRTVVSVKMIAEHTVEEKVLALQQRKQAVIQATVGTNDAAIMKSLTWDDVKELLA